MDNYSFKEDIVCTSCSKVNTANTQLTLISKIRWTNTDGFFPSAPHDGVIVRCAHCNQQIIACFHCNYHSSYDRFKKFYFNNTHRNVHKNVHATTNNDEDAGIIDCNEGGIDFNNNDDMLVGESSNGTNEGVVDYNNNNGNGNMLESANDKFRWVDFESMFDDDHSARYFFDEHRAATENTSFGGIKGIVHRCINQIEHGSGFADEETTKLYLDLLTLVHDMPETLQKKTMRLHKRIFEMHQARLKDDETVTHFPLTHLELNQQILINKLSMLKQLPTERVEYVDDHHAYVSISDTIGLMMAHGDLPLGWLQDEKGHPNSDGVNNCPAAHELREDLRTKISKQGYDPDKVAIGWVSPWSDGFVTSWVKMSKKGAWLFTVSICMPGDCKLFRLYTHVVALGPSSVNHDELIVHALKEIENLAIVKRRYCGIRKKRINTVFGLFVYAADRPERHCITYTSDGGKFGKRFSYSAFIDAQLLPSCNECFKSRLVNLLQLPESPNSDNCQVCCDWDYDTPNTKGWENSSTLKKVFPNEDNWSKYPLMNALIDQALPPPSRTLPEVSHIRPQRLTFQLMIEGVAFTFYHLTLDYWKKYNSDRYLQTFGVSPEISKMCLAASKAAKTELKDIHDAEEREQRVRLMMDRTELLRLGAIPAIWVLCATSTSLSLRMFIEIPMHHLFTGKNNTSSFTCKRILRLAPHPLTAPNSGLCSGRI